MERARAWARRRAIGIASLPPALRWVLVAAAVLHGAGLSWGMPASDGWDNDGIAPRDILPGLASTFTPGDFYTYPPAHLALLALLTAPWTVAATLHAGTTHLPTVIHEILAPRYMTAFAMTARLVALVMSLGIALALGKIAEELTSGERPIKERVLTLTTAIASAGVTFTYYGHTSNLDVPSLFWGILGVLAFVRAVARAEPERLRRAALFAAIAVTTKDQAYALFALALPIVLGVWFAIDPWPRANARRLVKEGVLAAALAAAVVLVVDGAVSNPSGFRARLAFLRGPASQDFSNYSRDAEGIVAILLEVGREVPRHYPWAFLGFVAFGFASTLSRRAAPALRAARLTPLAALVSFTVAFNIAARRTDDRFLLPQMLLSAVYAGIGMERVWSFGRGLASGLARAACVAFFVLAVWQALRVDLTFLFEPRYQTEAFLGANAKPGDTIEVHGLNVYLPRFPRELFASGVRVVRVGPPGRRGPLPGVEEVEAPYMDVTVRRPRFIVVSTCYAWRYLPIDTSSHEGHIYPPNQAREATDADATAFFGGLFDGRLGYRIVHDVKIRDTWFEPIEIHASLNCRTTTFERGRPEKG